MQALQGFLDELHHYAAHKNVPTSEAVAVASDLRAFLREVSDSDLGMPSFFSLFLLPYFSNLFSYLLFDETRL
jgi:hypothetical protein